MQNNSPLFRAMISDTLYDLPIGTKIGINPCDVTDNTGNQSITKISITDLNGILLSIHFGNLNSNYHAVEGSAVLIAPGIAIGATHVIKPHEKEIISGRLGAVAVGTTPEGLQIWRLTHIKFVSNSDLTIISLAYSSSLPSSNTLNIAKISTRLPSIGERLMICGFRASALNFDVINEKGESEFTYSGDTYVCNGIITAHYPLKRDSSMCTGPTLEVNCPSLSGMSGGPVFDSKGRLIGILTSSFDDAPSFVSLIWPALAAPFLGGWPGLSSPTKRNILSLPAGFCWIDKPEAISVASDPENGTYTASYKVWS